MKINISRIMKSKSLIGGSILAGIKGNKNKVLGVTVLEITNLDNIGINLLSINEGDIVLTSCYDIKDDVNKQIDLIKTLKECKASGIILFYLGQVIKNIDSQVIDLCNELSFPLICLDCENNKDMEYSSVISDVSSLLLQKSEQEKKRERESLNELLKLITFDKSLNEGLEHISKKYSISIGIFTEKRINISSYGIKSDELCKLFYSNYTKKGKSDKESICGELYIKYIKIGKNYFWLCFINNDKTYSEISLQNSIFYILEIWLELRLKEIESKSEKEFIRSIIKNDVDYTYKLAKEQNIDLKKIRGFLLQSINVNYEDFLQLSTIFDELRELCEVKIITYTYKKNNIFLLYTNNDLSIKEYISALEMKLENRNIKIPPVLTCGINGKWELFNIFPKSLEIYPLIKEVYCSKTIINRQEIQLCIEYEAMMKDKEKNYFYNSCILMLNILREYDEKNNSNMIKTLLDATLIYSMDLKKLSEKMYVHYNTIQYRIKKIEDLLQISMKNPADMSVLYFMALIEKNRIINKD